MKHFAIALSFLLISHWNSLVAQQTQPLDPPEDFTQLVNPQIDTHNSRWFYFNSACRPFGMVNLSPDTQTKGSWKSGYLYGDKHIR